MYMKRKFRYTIALLIMGVVIWLSPFLYVCASSSNPVITLDIQAGNIEYERVVGDLTKINNELHEFDFFNTTGVAKKDKNKVDYFIYESGYKCLNVEINTGHYKTLTQKQKEDTMQVVFKGLQKGDMSLTNRNKIYNFCEKSDETTARLVRELGNDTSADFANAYMLFKPFSGIVGTFLGLITLAMFMFLGITIALDLAYMTLPAVQLFIQSNDGSKPKWVSAEAVDAVTKSNGSIGNEEFRGALSIYLGTKTKQMLALAVCLLYLISGKIYDLLAYLMDYIKFVID